MTYFWKFIRTILWIYSGMVIYKITVDYYEIRNGPFGKYMTAEQIWATAKARNLKQVQQALDQFT